MTTQEHLNELIGVLGVTAAAVRHLLRRQLRAEARERKTAGMIVSLEKHKLDHGIRLSKLEKSKPQSPAVEAATELAAGIKDTRIADIESGLRVLRAGLNDHNRRIVSLEAASKNHGECIDKLEDYLLPISPPSPPAVPDPVRGEIWAGGNSLRWIFNVPSSVNYYDLALGGAIFYWANLADWHTWVRETGARKIWPEGGGK